MDRTADTTDLRELLASIRRRWPLIVVCALVGAAAALVFSSLQTKEYETTAKLLFRDPGFDQRIFGAPVIDANSDPERAAQTNVELVSLEVVASRTAERLGDGLDAEEVEERVTVEPEGESNVIAIHATEYDPPAAAKLANTFAATYIEFRREADQAKISAARRLVEDEQRTISESERAGGEGRLLAEQISELKTLEALQTGNAELVQPAIEPADPARPRLARNTAFGFVLAFLVGTGLALLTDRLDRRLRSAEEVEEVLDLPVLGTIPVSKALANPIRTSDNEISPVEPQGFAMLRARLRYFNVDRNLRTVLLTSPGSLDGKSTLSLHFAIAAAAAGSRVAVVQADMHHPTLGQMLDMQIVPGLSELLTGQATLEDVLQSATISDRGGAGSSTLHVVASGATPPNPLELMESAEMQSVLDELAASHDLVVIDTPPISLVADAIPLVRRVDGVLIVIRAGATSRESALALHEQLRELGSDVLGVVVNAVRPRGGRYGYGYGYGAQSQD